MANAISSSASSSSAAESSGGESSSSESSQSSSSSDGGKSYEIEDESVDKKIDDNKTIIGSFIVLAVIAFLLILGYKRKSDDDY